MPTVFGTQLPGEPEGAKTPVTCPTTFVEGFDYYEMAMELTKAAYPGLYDIPTYSRMRRDYCLTHNMSHVDFDNHMFGVIIHSMGVIFEFEFDGGMFQIPDGVVKTIMHGIQYPEYARPLIDAMISVDSNYLYCSPQLENEVIRALIEMENAGPRLIRYRRSPIVAKALDVVLFKSKDLKWFKDATDSETGDESLMDFVMTMCKPSTQIHLLFEGIVPLKYYDQLLCHYGQGRIESFMGRFKLTDPIQPRSQVLKFSEFTKEDWVALIAYYAKNCKTCQETFRSLLLVTLVYPDVHYQLVLAANMPYYNELGRSMTGDEEIPYPLVVFNVAS